MNLTGKTALVTGSTSGIGLGIALKLAEAGADLILNGFGDASAALVEVGRHGHKVGHHGADVSDPAQIAELFAYAERDFGGIDILVSNAGIASSAPIEDTSLALWNRNMDILSTGYFLVSREGFRMLRTQGIGGAVVFVASKNGLAASTSSSLYRASMVGLKPPTTARRFCSSRLVR